MFPERTVSWPVSAAQDITLESLTEVTGEGGMEILVVGCGSTFEPPPPELREALSEKGVVLEWMDTGAACRTLNVLLAEDRVCAAALIAID